MEALKALLHTVAADLNPHTDYKSKLETGGYYTPNGIKLADNAEQIERACGLRLGAANVIWKRLVDVQVGHRMSVPGFGASMAVQIEVCNNCISVSFTATVHRHC